MKHERYDVSFKISSVEEYLRLKQKTKTTIRSFARSKGISHATFFQWLKIYEQEREEKDDGSSYDVCLSESDDRICSSFIMISDPVRETLKDQPEEESNSDAKGSMRLLFKDMVIEFEKKDLSYVIRSIRQ